MGSTAIVIGAVGLATALICLFFGYLWGRSNVRAQVEDALDKARMSADAREFALREELDKKMLEIAGFRARAEELPRSEGQREPFKSEQANVIASGREPAEELGHNRQAKPKIAEERKAATSLSDSTEKTIQNLLKSIEERLQQPEEEPQVVNQESTTPQPPKSPVDAPSVVTQPSSRPAPKELPAAEPCPTVKDEWQEFAASLAALTSRQK